MTTTKRYPTDPFLLDYDDFMDADTSGTYFVSVKEKCHNCGTALGDTADGFVSFWRDADLNQPDQNDAWCHDCVDEPDEVQS